MTNEDIARAYIAALGRNASGDELAAFFHEDVVQEEFPSRLVPTGKSHARAELLERSTQVGELLSWHRYELKSVLSSGAVVALELEWRGEMRTSLGPLRQGQELRAEVAIFLELEDGRIRRQRNYDCYYPFE
jgi:ketosteroid isomerase-like protein